MKKFLHDRLSSGGFLAAFGKHPGWDDHADDLGLVTPSLVEARRLLYLEGISGQLASGAWDRLEENGEAIDFDHYWLWTCEDQSIAGSLWASSDGKGRSRFPMIACAQVAQIDEFTPFEQIDEFERRCKDATTSEEVVEAWRTASASLKTSAPDEPEVIPLTAAPSEIAGIISRLRESENEPIRLPSVATEPLDNLKFWRRFAAGIYEPSAPLLLFQPREHPWTDLIAGGPAPADLFPLRASAARIPIWNFQCAPEAIDYVERVRAGEHEPQRRSWFSRFFR